MNEAWYRVAGMAFSAFSALAAGAVVFLSIRQNRLDAQVRKSAERDTPGLGEAYALRVVSAGFGRRLTEGDRFSVPDEGILGSARSCDVVIPYRGVRGRVAFFRAEKDGLHMMPLARDGFLVDGEQARPGDEAILREGAELRLKKLVLRLTPAGKGDGAPASFRLRGGKLMPDTQRAGEENVAKGKPGKEENLLRRKKLEKRRSKTAVDKGKVAGAEKSAGRTPSRTARSKENG